VRKAFKPKKVRGKKQKPWKAKILKCSWGKTSKAYNAKHGLTAAVLKAYNEHHAIVLKPDAFWQAILLQFGFYVNANAEALRDRLVDF